MASAAAMVSASTGAMNSVLAKLTTLLEEESKLGKGIRRKLRLLRDELTSMKGLLEKLADAEYHDSLVKGWMRQVREMTYDLDDSMDEFGRWDAPLGGAKPGFLRKVLKKIKGLKVQRHLSEEIQELERRIREATERRSRYKIDDHLIPSTSHTVVVEHPLPALPVHKDSLVGMDGPTKELIGLLTDDDQQQLKGVSIVGVGGLGKTTLAMNVYERLKQQFDCRAFVSVSRSDTNRILRDILIQVGAQEQGTTEAADEPKLVDALREFLSLKRYFIVIDDIWSTSTWRIVRYALPENDLRSRILVTTRIMSVADSCCYPDKGHVFQMRHLTEFEARALFFKRIFGSESEESCPPHLVAISNDILKGCCGLPLAVITIASLLASSPYATKVWEQIRDYVGSSLDTDRRLEHMRSILNRSYLDLPLHLKTCFLYLSMFPEDYVIDRKQLVRRWIAEGFISAERVEDLEEVGESYFNELINRSLVQPVSIHYDGRVDACRVHDMILDLIVSKSVEENFVITFGIHENISGLQDKVRRLSLHCRYQWDTFRPSEITTSHVRSLNVIGSNGQMPALANFGALRVLHLEDCVESESHYLKNIGRLYLLKYLRIQTPSYIQLPEEIGRLQYLETLDLSRAPRSRLPKSIVRLKKLIYLLINNVKLPEGFGRMQSLQELSCVKIDSTSSLQELGNLSVLRVLDMKVYVDTLALSLTKLSTPNLRFLSIESVDGCSLNFLLDCWSIPCYHLQEFQMKSKYYFPSVPRWMSSLVNLTLLRINIEILGEVLQILGELPSLLALLLTVKSTTPEQGLIVRGSGFKHLKQFDFTCRDNWSVLMFEKGAMRNLEKLRVVFGAQGGCVASGFQFSIEHLTSLKHLFVEINCRDAWATDVKAAKDAEDTIKNAASKHPNDPRLELQRLSYNLSEEENDQNEGETAAYIQLSEEHIVQDEMEIDAEDWKLFLTPVVLVSSYIHLFLVHLASKAPIRLLSRTAILLLLLPFFVLLVNQNRVIPNKLRLLFG